MDQKPKAFVIMPFDAEFTPIYEDLIRPSLSEVGYEVARADSFLDQSNILSDIIRGISTANLVIADLTASNPNVFYELGLCHALRVPTVLIAQSITDVPFDLRSYKILIYETHFNKVKKLRTVLQDIGGRHIRNELVFQNPVIDFSDSKPLVDERTNQKPLDATSSQQLFSEPDDEGILNYLSEGEEASQELTRILGKFVKENELMTNRIKRHTTSLQALNNNPTTGSAGRFHKVTLLAASDMNSFSKKVEDLLPLFEEAIDKMSENYSGFIRIAEAKEEDREVIIRFRETIRGLLAGSLEASKSMHSYRESTISLGERKISKEITRASRRQAEALNGILSSLQKVEAFSSKTLEMIESRFGEVVNQV